ncbi:DUF192 domain-containing protein [Anthocerotibacter panamensis]|uniref:DUF192 domain-containing protein n=1 Tax=Anthocerotibacter panamensis TaxID=2857077 RepID=UPI001C401713|nr:DUF192 domain-containing protein [Anthocerotibacter panamensis]
MTIQIHALLALLLVSELTGPALAQTSLSQSLPIAARVALSGQVIELEVARTEQQQQIGLMGRQNLPANRGMVFLFDSPRFTRFWMGYCFIPLDMIFIRKGRIVEFAQSAQPCPTGENCPQYPPKGVLADQVLELKAGQVQALKLKINDPISFKFFSAEAPLPLSQQRDPGLK